MAVYTIELYRLIQSGYDVGMQDYQLPSFLTTPESQAAWREQLNKAIIDNFYFDEICCLPPDRWKRLFNNTLNLKMLYYSRMYDALSANWSFDSGSTLEEIITDTGTIKDTGTIARTYTDARTGTDTVTDSGTDTSTYTGYGLQVASDTPAALLNVENQIEDNTYASAASKNSIQNTSENKKGTSTKTEYGNNLKHDGTDTNDLTKATDMERKRTTKGVNGKSSAELFMNYQKALVNVNEMLFNELRECFMGVY